MPEPNSGCLLWLGGADRNGYGRIRVGGIGSFAHRVAYAVARGPIPDGKIVCHKCDVPGCINVDHLFLGTTADNVEDKIAKGRLKVRFGMAHADATLTDDLVRSIRAETGSLREIAEKYGLQKQHVHKLRQRLSWKHVQ